MSQFEGYENLEELDWDGYRARHGDIPRLDRILRAEGDDPDRYKIAKQADTLMLFFLFTRRAAAVDPRAAWATSSAPDSADGRSTTTTHGSRTGRR